MIISKIVIFIVFVIFIFLLYLILVLYKLSYSVNKDYNDLKELYDKLLNDNEIRQNRKYYKSIKK